MALPELPTDASYQNPTAAQPQAFAELSVSGTQLHYTGSDSVAEGSSYTVTVPVTGAVNYEDYTVTVTLIRYPVLPADSRGRQRKRHLCAGPDGDHHGGKLTRIPLPALDQ